MSSRALRKLQNDSELLEQLVGNLNSEDTKSQKQKTVKKQYVNLFDLMNNGDDLESDDGVEEDDTTEENTQNLTNDQPERIKISLPSKSKKKANRKKNKKKNKQKTESENIEETPDNNDDEEDFEKIIQQFRKKDIQKFGLKGQMPNAITDSESDDFETASEQGNDNESPYTYSCTMDDLRMDPGFTRFLAKYMKGCEKFFNNDFKKLDPHFEFKMLFDDLTSESLEDIDSMTSTHVSPQQLKQIQRMKRLIKNWGGKDHKSVPNGPGLSPHRLQFTKIREDWIPAARGELMMKNLSADELLDWQLWQRPNDWKEVIQEDIKDWKQLVSFYKFEPLNSDISRKAMTEFYMSVVLHPDHEALVHLISSKYPYHVPGLLQVALIMVRQGDRSNTNGLIQRALFVFDRALKATLRFNSVSCQLPYIYFFNRQFYLAIFRYILTLSQRGAVGTASEWCKALWSLSPLEDPLGCRYFIDHYLLLNNEFNYLIELSKSPLVNSYHQWYTLGISLGTVLSYLNIGDTSAATEELKKTFKYHSYSLAVLYKEKLGGNFENQSILKEENETEEKILELKSYIARFPILWKNGEHVCFLTEELKKLIENSSQISVMRLASDKKSDNESSPFFVHDIPINLLRFAILSEESSVMASIPPHIWSDYDVYDFDVLPPLPNTRESLETIESIKSFVNDYELAASQINVMQDEDLLNQIRQMSLEEYLGNINPEEE